MDVTQTLKDTENALREFIALVLSKALGDNWINKCGVSEERIQKWEDRKREEEQRQGESGIVEERLIYYADFFDLKTILKKHWQHFSPALGHLKTIDVFLSELGKARDPDAHRRVLLPHQKNLVLGISGDIRSRLVRYRSKQETSEDYFPRIESICDNFGNVWTPDMGMRLVITRTRLRPNDILELVVTASDPLGQEFDYAVKYFGGKTTWQNNNELSLKISELHISKDFNVMVMIRSRRQFHAHRGYDDFVVFYYEVLPPKTD